MPHNNTILTPQMITREALRILHQKLNFISNINTQYDDRFAQSGAKIGDTLAIRLPNEYTIRSGRVISSYVDTVEQSVPLVVNNQRGVDVNFSTAEMTLSLDDFSQRILEPAMAVLASNVEADALNMIWDVANTVDNIGSALTFRKTMEARKRLNDNLAPMDNNRSFLLNTADQVEIVDSLKGLFQDSEAIKKQYKEGKMGRTGGFDWYENTLMPVHTTGTAASTTGYTVSGAVTTNGATSVTLAAGSDTLNIGDVVTFAGTFRVHPETKQPTNELQQFVVTSAVTGPGDMTFSPAIWTSTGRQNVVATGIANGTTMTKVGGPNYVYKPSIAFHRDAFVFATADLIMPKGVDFASREVFQGISMRIVRQYDINNDNLPCRIDVLYGYKTVRQQLACKVLSL